MSIELRELVASLTDSRNNQHKVPRSSDHHVGVEVELVSPVNIATLCAILSLADLNKYVNAGTDSSIHPDQRGGQGIECRICAKESEIEDVMDRFFEVVLDIGCYVNDSCGMHVHIDARNRDKMQMFKNFYAAQELMFSCVTKARRKNNYCIPISENAASEFLETEDSSVLGRGAINVAPRGGKRTVEIRVHQGCLDIETVAPWITLLTRIADFKREVPSWTLYNSDRLPESVREFLREKVSKYGKHKL